ncbi:MAG: aminotransferase class V-fold PLP-dependent enzyme [Pseudomonadota bacterium]
MSAPSRADARALDETDPLAALRERFVLADGVLYLDGNSLGPPLKASLDRLEKTARNEWGGGLIRSWNDANWIDLPKTCGAKIARIIGAPEDDVIVADSVTANIFKLAAAAWRAHGGALACEAGEFPTDEYVLEGLAELVDAPLKIVEAGDDPFADGARVLVKSAVHYKTAKIANIAKWERAAAEKDALIIWDLSHAAGLIDLRLASQGARCAVGCGYKFLNGGPGAPSFIYVARSLANELRQPLSGWMGHAAPFDFAAGYRPAPGVARFACGTPPILSLSALDAALEIFDGLDLGAVEEKARALGDFFLSCTQQLGFASASPGVGHPRGGHVSLVAEHGYAIMQALIARGVIGDFRAPDLMRFGFSPLYLRFQDIWDAADALRAIVATEDWRKPEFSVRQAVT